MLRNNPYLSYQPRKSFRPSLAREVEWEASGVSLFLLFVLLLAFALFLLFFIPRAFAVTFSCSFTNTSCGAGEAGLLRAENNSASHGYNNAHAQLMNYTGTAYNYTLCCVTDENHTLSNDCSNENATVILRLADETNTHVQVPSVNTYSYAACLALSPGNLSCEYVNTSCSSGYSPVLSIASSEANNGLYNQTNAHVGNYSYYTLSVCCKGGNTPPTVPTLLYPANNNNSVFERNITFDWSDSTDADGDAITYEFNLTQATCPDDNQTGLTSSNYTSGELCVDKVYDWTVRACDANDCSAWASTYNFTIASTLGITFTVNNTNFGEMARNATDNTTDDNPPPFIIENTGNVKLNVTIKADDPLFTTSGLGNDTFQYKVREKEAGAYDSAQTTWTNVSASFTALITNLGYAASADEAHIDVLVRLPYEEAAGYKSSTINVSGEYLG